MCLNLAHAGAALRAARDNDLRTRDFGSDVESAGGERAITHVTLIGFNRGQGRRADSMDVRAGLAAAVQFAQACKLA